MDHSPQPEEEFQLVPESEAEPTRGRGRAQAGGGRVSKNQDLLNATEKLIASAATRKARGVINTPIPLELPFWTESKRALPNPLAREIGRAHV